MPYSPKKPERNIPKVFSSEYDARQELLKHICDSCLKGEYNYIDYNGEWFTEQLCDAPNIYDIQDLLGTACGCEWDYVEED